MIEPNKISEIASKYGFNEYQINDLIDEMSKIHAYFGAFRPPISGLYDR